MKINRCICIVVAIFFCLTQSLDVVQFDTNDTLIQFAIFSGGNNSVFQAFYTACLEERNPVNCFRKYLYETQPFNVCELFAMNKVVCA